MHELGLMLKIAPRLKGLSADGPFVAMLFGQLLRQASKCSLTALVRRGYCSAGGSSICSRCLHATHARPAKKRLYPSRSHPCYTVPQAEGVSAAADMGCTFDDDAVQVRHMLEGRQPSAHAAANEAVAA